MIAWIRSGIMQDMDRRAWLFLAALFLVGFCAALMLRTVRSRLICTAAVCTLIFLLDLAALLPTPAAWSGDGYAVTQEIGTVGAVYLLPVAIGAALSCLLSFLLRTLMKHLFS